MAQRMGPVEWLLLLLLSLLWGGTFFFAEVALVTLSPLTIVLGRTALAALVLLVLVRLGGETLPRRLFGAFLVMGAINGAIPYSLIFWGQTHMDGGLAAIMNATTPLFSILLGHFLARSEESLTMGRVTGVAIGLLGVVVLVGPGVLRGLDWQAVGQFAILGASLSYAFAALYGRRFREVPPLVTAAGQVTGTAVLILPLALIVDRPWELQPSLTPSWGLSVAALAAMAVLSTALAYLIYFRILSRAGATNVVLVTFLVPVSALTLGALFLGERPAPAALAGMALIFAGIAVIDGRSVVWLAARLPGRLRLSR